MISPTHDQHDSALLGVSERCWVIQIRQFKHRSEGLSTMLKRRVVAAVAATVAVTVLAAPGAQASAKRGCRSPSASNAANPAAAVDAFVAARRTAGDSEAQIQSALHDTMCLVRVDTGPPPEDVVSVLSSDSAVDAEPPAIDYDPQTRRYYAISTWRWTDNSWTKEGVFVQNVGKNIGGPDGFATSFNKDLILTGYSVTVFGDAPYPRSAIFPTASDANSNGAGFIFQDKGECIDVPSGCSYRLSNRSGQEVISFRGTGTCQTVYGFSKYDHTWSSTKVTGFGIGVASISISTTSQSYQHPYASQPGNTAQVC